MPNTVYICTRDRLSNLSKVVPRWLEQDFRVVLVVEPEQEETHSDLADEMGWPEEGKIIVDVVPLPRSNRGIGYSRHYAVSHAQQQKLKSIIMADDDIRPSQEQTMHHLITEAKKPGILGVGAVNRYVDHMNGGALSANSGVILCPGGWGGRLYGLNVNKAVILGNYDVKLDCLGEDDELKRQGIAAGIPWAVHCDVWADSIGSRFQPGGVQAYVGLDRTSREERNHWLIHKTWPEYVSCPPKKFRMEWQKMLTDYIPEWRERSAIHGGTW
jgi:hypothetical protein